MDSLESLSHQSSPLITDVQPDDFEEVVYTPSLKERIYALMCELKEGIISGLDLPNVGKPFYYGAIPLFGVIPSALLMLYTLGKSLQTFYLYFSKENRERREQKELYYKGQLSKELFLEVRKHLMPLQKQVEGYPLVALASLINICTLGLFSLYLIFPMAGIPSEIEAVENFGSHQ